MKRLLPLCCLLLAATSSLAAAEPDPRDAFFERLTALCSSTFEGYSSFPDDPAHALFGKLLVATVANCTEDEIRIPFAVGDDRSRTWIVSRSADGLLLKHDHRHEDGTPDEITMYGGWASQDGSADLQSFPADAETARLIPEAATNVWTLSLSEGGDSLTYDLQRHDQPRFRATLTRR